MTCFWNVARLLLFSLLAIQLAPADAVRGGTVDQASRMVSGYVLGPEDQFVIRGVDIDEIGNAPIRIDSDGSITLAIVGKLQAAGLTLAELRSLLIERLSRYVRNPQVTVNLVELHSHPVSVIGAVNTPGVQQIQGPKTIMEVLSMAGGLKPDARYAITLTRRHDRGAIPLKSGVTDDGKFSIATINIQSIMDGTNPEANLIMAPDDLISVPRSELVFVVGAVHKSGGFVVGEREKLSALQCLALAEGLDRAASPKESKIMRTDARTSVRTEREINLSAILTGAEADPTLEPGDILFVPNSRTKSVALRSLEMALGMASGIGTGLVIYR